MAITPYLYYEDVDAALRFLARAFGMKRSGPVMRNKEGKAWHAAMQLGPKEIVMMGHPGPQYRSPRRLGAATQSLYVNVSDVDKLFARAQKAGGKVLEEPNDQRYGDRRCGFEDPEGHQWYFAHRAKRRKRG